MKNIHYLIFCLLYVSTACESDDNSNEEVFQSISTPISTLFDEEEFPDESMNRLLVEIRICNPLSQDSIIDGFVPCSPNYFKFYTYDHNRDLSNAFLLQVRKGVNNFKYRRLLIFTREKEELVLVNGIIGYLVEKRSRPNKIDDLVVAVVDNINGHYERYDVLLRFKDGKYRFIEAIGDLHGVFKTEELKKEASKQIKARIEEKELIF